MRFTEEKLEQAVIELFESEHYTHIAGEHIHKELPDAAGSCETERNRKIL